jgi:hypothetical protein
LSRWLWDNNYSTLLVSMGERRALRAVIPPCGAEWLALWGCFALSGSRYARRSQFIGQNQVPGAPQLHHCQDLSHSLYTTRRSCILALGISSGGSENIVVSGTEVLAWRKCPCRPFARFQSAGIGMPQRGTWDDWDAYLHLVVHHAPPCCGLPAGGYHGNFPR